MGEQFLNGLKEADWVGDDNSEPAKMWFWRGTRDEAAAPWMLAAPHVVDELFQDWHRLRAEVARLKEEKRKAIGKCHWPRDTEFMFPPCTDESIPIPDDEWMYCPWCGGEIEYEEG